MEERFQELNIDGVCEFILNDNDLFYPGVYKTMQNSTNGILLDCKLVRHNGKMKFVYFTDGLYSFEELIKASTEREIAEAVYSLSRAVGVVESNGFLSLSCLDKRTSHIFWDSNKHTIRLIYFPVHASKDTRAKREAEEIISRNVYEAMAARSGNPEIKRIRDSLSTQGILGGSATEPRMSQPDRPMPKPIEPVRRPVDMPVKPVATGVGNNAEETVLIQAGDGRDVFRITRFPFVIGRSESRADGVINLRTISGTHCRIDKVPDGYTIVDLNSSNGTTINGIKMVPNQPMRLKSGMRIGMASERYVVKIL